MILSIAEPTSPGRNLTGLSSPMPVSLEVDSTTKGLRHRKDEQRKRHLLSRNSRRSVTCNCHSEISRPSSSLTERGAMDSHGVAGSNSCKSSSRKMRWFCTYTSSPDRYSGHVVKKLEFRGSVNDVTRHDID